MHFRCFLHGDLCCISGERLCNIEGLPLEVKNELLRNRLDAKKIITAVRPVLLRLAIALSASAVLAILLSSLSAFSFVLPAVSGLLLGAVLCWAAFFASAALGQDERRLVLSAQGTGGDIVQVATRRAWEREQGESEDEAGAASFAAGEKHFRTGHYAQAAKAFAEALQREKNLAAALNLSAALLAVAEFEQAREVLEEGLQRAERQQRRLLRAALHTNLGILHMRQGSLIEALAAYEEAVNFFRQEGDMRGAGDALLNTANARVHRGDYDGARRAVAEAAKAHRRTGGVLGRANALACRGYILIDSGEQDKALDTLDKAIELYAKAGSKAGRAHARMLMGNAQFKKGDIDKALVMYEETSALYAEIGDPLGEASALVNIGNVHFKQGDLAEAQSDYNQALQVHVKAGNVLGQARTLTNIGSALARQRKGDEALEVLEQAQALYQRAGTKGRIVDNVDRLIVRIKRRRERAKKKRS